MSTITQVKTYDFRFPTSQTLSGSDAMNPDPDYSSAYVEISTSADDGIKGVGFVFTIGRGNDVVCKAIKSMSQVLIGRNTEELLDNMRIAWDLFVHDSQLRLFLVKSVFRVSSLIFFGFRHEECRPVVCFTGCPSCRT